MKKILVLLFVTLLSCLFAENSSEFIRKHALSAAQNISRRITDETVIAVNIDDNTDNHLFSATLIDNLLKSENIHITDIDNRRKLFKEAVKQHGRFHDEDKNEIRFKNPELMILGSIKTDTEVKFFKKKHVLTINLNVDEIHTNITLHKIAEKHYFKESVSYVILITAMVLLTVVLVIFNSMTKGYFSRILTGLYILFVIAVILWYFLI